jgi:hypothetical protein
MQSRRDDLISLFYLLQFFMNGSLWWYNEVQHEQNLRGVIGQLKIKMKAHEMCRGKAKNLIPFGEEVMSYKFQEMPNYAKLKHLLVCVLL